MVSNTTPRVLRLLGHGVVGGRQLGTGERFPAHFEQRLTAALPDLDLDGGRARNSASRSSRDASRRPSAPRRRQTYSSNMAQLRRSERFGEIDRCLANEESLAASDETTTRQLASHAGIRSIGSRLLYSVASGCDTGNAFMRSGNVFVRRITMDRLGGDARDIDLDRSGRRKRARRPLQLAIHAP
jgi:hypothetical protein